MALTGGVGCDDFAPRDDLRTQLTGTGSIVHPEQVAKTSCDGWASNHHSWSLAAASIS